MCCSLCLFFSKHQVQRLKIQKDHVLHLIVALGDTRKAFELLEQSMSVKSSILTALDCLTIVNSLELKLLLAQFVIGRKHIQNNDPALVERIQHTHVVVLSLKMLIGLSSSSPSSSSSNTCTTSLTSVTSVASSVAASSTLSTQYRHLIGKPDVLVESLLLGKCMYK
jgi:hypothetical protein